MTLSRRDFLLGATAVAATVAVPIVVVAPKAKYSVAFTADGGFAKVLWPGINAMWKAEYDSIPTAFPDLWSAT